MSSTGIVWDIRKYSLHDGPGIRTTVFLKGCPLTCRWCCNPESQDGQPELSWTRERCLACGTCAGVCSRSAVTVDRSGGRHIDRARCDVCGDCASRCPGEAMTVVGREMRADEVLREVAKDSIFYSRSGGGLTLSGGEPLAQAAFAAELLMRYRTDHGGFHSVVETCGEAEWSDVALLAPHTDLFLYDIKHMDAFEHRRFTGADNERILENATRLAASGAQIVVRLPLVPGVNDDEENLRKTAQFARSVLGVSRIDLLPYHRLGESKYRRTWRHYLLADMPAATDEQVAAARTVLESCGMQVQIGG